MLARMQVTRSETTSCEAASRCCGSLPGLLSHCTNQDLFRLRCAGSALNGPVETETLRLLGFLTRETTRCAGTLMVREDSHKQHEKFWGEVSGMSEADKAANGDFYMFKPEVGRCAHRKTVTPSVPVRRSGSATCCCSCCLHQVCHLQHCMMPCCGGLVKSDVCVKISSVIACSTGWAQEVGYWDRFQAKALRGYGPGSLFIWDSRTVHQNCPPSDPTLWR